jgi:shikimate kinase
VTAALATVVTSRVRRPTRPPPADTEGIADAGGVRAEAPACRHGCTVAACEDVSSARDRADTASVGVRNYLVEGVSGTGKTSVCRELSRRGYHAINGDKELAYQGDPETGEAINGASHEHHIWDVGRVHALVAEQHEPVTFFCGGSRNFSKFIDLFDDVFVLDVDLDTLHRRLDQRRRDEWGSKQSERDLIIRLHRTREDIPRTGVVIDATPPLAEVVDEILRRVGLARAVDRNC